MLQVKTGIHHLAHIGSEGKVAPEQRFNDIPFRVRQIARIASPIILVFLTIFVCPHFNLLLTEINSPLGDSVKQALSQCIRSAKSSSFGDCNGDCLGMANYHLVAFAHGVETFNLRSSLDRAHIASGVT